MQNTIDKLKKLFGIEIKYRDLPASNLIIEQPHEKDAVFEEVFGKGQNFEGQGSKDWRPWRPKHEVQAHGDCTNFSRNNVAEIKAKEQGILDPWGEEINFSDLDSANGSGTTKSGNSLRNTAEWSRTVGPVLERFAPYTRDWDSRASVIAKIPKDAKRYKLGNWQWLDRGVMDGLVSRQSIKNALEATPVQIGIPLGESYTKRKGTIDDPITPPTAIKVWHAIVILYVDENNMTHCWDHYAREIIVLSADYPITWAMAFADLPATWRGEGVEDDKLHKRLIGKIILLVESAGAAYRVYADKLVKVRFDISDKQLFDDTTNEYWRPKNKFLGVTNADFERVKKQVLMIGGEILTEEGENIDIRGIIN